MNVHATYTPVRAGMPALGNGLGNGVAGLDGAAPALLHGSAAMSYADFDSATAAMAAAMRAAGVQRGDVVAVMLPRGIAPIVAHYAAWRLGAAYLPLDPEWPDARAASLLARAGAKLLVAPAVLAARIAPGLASIDPEHADTSASYDETDAQADDVAYVIYTSGSTGEPKGVEVTHGNLAALVAWHNAAFGIAPGTRCAHIAGMAFDAAAWEVWPVIAAGATLVIPDDEMLRYDAAGLADWLVAEQIEVAFAPTAIAEQLVARDWPAQCRLRILLTGAEALKARPRADTPFALINNYGPTECTVVATSGAVSASGEGLPGIGQPIAGTQVHLLDAAGAPVADGAEGEVWIGGAQVARGYRGDVALTAERFHDHPQWGRLYRTGDLAVRDAAGDFHFRGRADAQFKLRGHRIEPAEIEAALARVEGVAAAAVALRGDELIGYVVARAGHALAARHIREALAQELPAMMVPARFATLAALPLNSSGKLDRGALPDPAASPLAESAARQPETPTERRLAVIVGEVIGRHDFGVDDDFFLLGGHSLLGTQVIIRAREAFGVELTLLHLFEARTVAVLSAKIEELALAHLATLSDEDIARMMKG